VHDALHSFLYQEDVEDDEGSREVGGAEEGEDIFYEIVEAVAVLLPLVDDVHSLQVEGLAVGHVEDYGH
jgi:hypothetical protein